MSARRKRVKKVLALRQEQLEKRVFALTTAQTGASVAAQTLEDERRRLELAVHQRAVLSQVAADVGSWRDADAWIASRAQTCELARRALIRAEQAVERARREVVAVNRSVQRIQALDHRLELQARAALAKREQLLEDELASRRFDSMSRSRSAGSDP
jgi:flagellar export protein FliJ